MKKRIKWNPRFITFIIYCVHVHTQLYGTKRNKGISQ